MTSTPATGPQAAKIQEAIARIASEQLEWQGPLGRELRLVEDLELDSMRLFALAAAVENHFQVCLDEEDEGQLVTVGDLVDLVGRKLVP